MSSHTRVLVAMVATASLACGPKPGRGEAAIEEAAARGDGRVIVGGCLRQPGEGGRFLLANSQLASDATGVPIDGAQAPPLPTGEGPMTSTIPIVTRSPDYVLQPPPNVDLKTHVGQQVQVTAVLHQASDDAPVVEQSDAAGILRAEEVRLIAEECIGY